MQSGLAKVEVFIDSRVHSRLIGSRGRNIRKIMDDYNVEIKFPRDTDPEPELIVITGGEANCEEAKDHLLNLEEEYVSQQRVMNFLTKIKILKIIWEFALR